MTGRRAGPPGDRQASGTMVGRHSRDSRVAAQRLFRAARSARPWVRSAGWAAVTEPQCYWFGACGYGGFCGGCC